MKILFISPQPFFQWRGSPIRVGFDVQALAQLGYEVDFLTLPFGEDREIPGVRLIRVPNLFRVRNIPIGPSAIKAAFDILLFFKGLSLALRRRYDVIHGIEDAGVIGVAIAFIARAKTVYEKHSDPSSYKKGVLRNLVMRGYAAVERFTARHVDAVIGTGPGLAEQVRAIPGSGRVYDICDIPSSLTEADPDKSAEIRRSLQKHENEILVAYVGSFAVYQGIDLMFEAIARLAGELAGVRYVIIGGTSTEIEERKTWLSERNASDCVEFLGKIPPDELPCYLAAADILLSPRVSGVNTPLKLLDYFKARGAIVATDIAANRLILDDSTAILTAVDPTAFADGIRRMTADSDLRRNIADRGRELVDSRYNFSEFSRLLGDCYRSVLEGVE